MNTIAEVSKTGMAIEQAVRIIDTAMPKGQNLSHEYDYAMSAPLYNLAHSGIEIGLKALIRQLYGDHPGGHNLRNLFRKLKGKDPKRARSLEDTFTDIVNFYTIDTGRWVHFQSLDSYFMEYGSEKLFQAYRYWAIENKDMHHIPLIVHRELLTWLGDYCLWGNQRLTSRRVEYRVRWGVTKGIEKHINHCEICYKNSQNPLQCLMQIQDSSKNEISAKLSDVYYHNSNNGNDECINQALRDIVQHLEESDDPAVQYYVSRLKDLPKGSIPVPDDIELVVNPAGVVRIRNGVTLGTVSQQVDGIWRAQTYWLNVNPKYAKTMDDAMHWILDVSTEIVTVSVDGGPYRSMRAMSPVLLFRSSSENGPWSPYEMKFAVSPHELSVNQHINVKANRYGIIQTAEGIVSTVNGEEVKWG